MRPPTFEQFLQGKHAEQYEGTDDAMPDAFDSWLALLDVQEVMGYVQEWGDTTRRP